MEKICICSTGPNLNCQVSPIFGRCPYFLIINEDEVKAIANSALESGTGAGVASSQTVVSEGIKAVACGNFGPNAFSILQASGIKIYPVSAGLTGSQVLERYKKGELQEMRAPSAPGHFGLPGKGFGRRRVQRRNRGQ